MADVLTPDEVAPVLAGLQRVLASLDAALLGQPQLHRMVLAGILSRGHVLLEGMPGVGKTVLIRTLGELLSLSFSRVQFTPDLMPGDITGSLILEEADNGRRQLVFRPGPIFTNVLLADEVNRASPKTQSAMLEAMAERRVTVMGETRELPFPFFVLASQNPIDLEGTYPLPEAQVDRFLFKLHVGRPAAATLERMISDRRRGEANPARATLGVSEAELQRWFETMDRVALPDAVAGHIARLVAATHADDAAAPDLVKRYVLHGASPRAAIGIAESARAVALLSGRPVAGFEDVDAVSHAVLQHRRILNHEARFEKVLARDVVTQLLRAVDPVAGVLPAGVHA